VTPCQMVSGPVSIGGSEKGKFDGDKPDGRSRGTQIRLRETDPVQLRTQEIDVLSAQVVISMSSRHPPAVPCKRHEPGLSCINVFGASSCP
jgi:hypothetical protein